MNILSKIVPFKMRRGLAALGAAGALAACTYNELQPVPDGREVSSTIYVVVPQGGTPEFTQVVR